MSYTALYRKYRPVTFSQVKGQDPIVTTLRNQVRSGRIAHAYLFCGTRGTGKTTVAKILARAVNCASPVDGEPCGECEVCKGILSGRLLNMIEIDGASNRGVDDIRTIREEVAYPPPEGRKKVYIIDEVHMLTREAFNALLKTLEEPPEYVMFILATTEAHKVPLTILSRCQRYDFRRIPVDVIREQLADLFREEGVGAEPEAIRHIARKAEGGMRDALSLADRCISFYLGQKLTYERVLNVLGAVDVELLSTLFRSIRSQDTGKALLLLSDMIESGRDLTAFVSDFTGYLRDILILRAAENTEDLLDVTDGQLQLLREDAGKVRDDTLTRYIQVFSELSSQMRYAYNRRVLAEVAVIRLCKPQMQDDELSLKERLRRLEKLAEEGVPRPKDAAYNDNKTAVSASDPASVPGRVSASDRSAADVRMKDPVPTDPAEQQETPVYTRKAAPEDLQKIESVWKGIVSGVKSPQLREVLKTSVRMFRTDSPDDETLIIAFTNIVGERYVGKDEPARELEGLIAGKLGIAARVQMILKEDIPVRRDRLAQVQVQEETLQKLRQHINMPIEISAE